MRELGFDPQQILTGNIGEIMDNASPYQETECGNVRAEVIAALYAAGRGEKVTRWMTEQSSGS